MYLKTILFGGKDMKTFVRKILPAFVMALTLCLSAFVAVGCNDDNDNNDVPVTSVLMEKTAITLDPGQEETLKAYTNIDATNKALTWTSDKEAVATVDTNGKVTAVAEGTAKITATSVANKEKSATCTVTVNKAKAKEVLLVSANNAAGQPTDSLSFRDDGTYTFVGKFLNAVDVTYDSTWEVKDGALKVPSPAPTLSTAFGDFVPTLDVKVVGDHVTFKVNSENSEGPIVLGDFIISKEQCTTLGITVGKPIETVAVTGITLKQESITIQSSKTANFDEIVEIAPANATNKSYSVSVKLDLTGSLILDKGSIKGLKAGTAYVTIKTTDGGFEKDCAVTVEYPTKLLTGENYFAADTAFVGSLDLTALDGAKTEKLYVCKPDGMVEIYDNYKLAQLGYYKLTGTADNYTKIDMQRFSDDFDQTTSALKTSSFTITESENKMTFNAGNALLPLNMTECEYSTNAHFGTQKAFTASLFGGAMTKTWTFNTDGTMTDEGGQTGTYSIVSVDGKFLNLTMNLQNDGTSTYTLVLDSTTGKYSFEVLGATATETTPASAE